MSESAGGGIQAREVEQDVRLHGGEQGETSDPGRLVQEIGTGDLAVITLLGGLTHNDINHVHLAHDVLEGTDGGI